MAAASARAAIEYGWQKGVEIGEMGRKDEKDEKDVGDTHDD